MELIEVGQDQQILIDDIFPAFKGHLRVLHDVEDDEIKMYLGAAIDAIGIYGGTEVYPTNFEVYYPYQYDYSGRSNLIGWYAKRWNIRDVVVINAASVDITTDYTIDGKQGMIYPHPNNQKITFSTGYLAATDMPLNLKNIIMRLGANFYENRESIRVGEPKLLPDWLTHAMASVWQPRC